MRLRIPIAILASCLGASSAADAAYVIKLKNGNEFITARYWQDGKQVLFETYDGIFGIDKAFVSRVEKTDKPIRLITSTQAAQEVKPVETGAKAESEAKKPPLNENQEPAGAKKNEDDPIFKHFLSIRERSKNINRMLSSELNLFAKDLEDLKRAMQLSGKTNEFLAEFGELHDIADRLEDAMRARR